MTEESDAATGGAGDAAGPVESRVVLVDAAAMSVVWMNEAASADLTEGAVGTGSTLAEGIPLAHSLGLPEVVTRVAETGESMHRRIPLVSTARGSLIIVASVYRLPSGEVLVVMDRTFEAGRAGSRRS